MHYHQSTLLAYLQAQQQQQEEASAAAAAAGGGGVDGGEWEYLDPQGVVQVRRQPFGAMCCKHSSVPGCLWHNGQRSARRRRAHAHLYLVLREMRRPLPHTGRMQKSLHWKNCKLPYGCALFCTAEGAAVPWQGPFGRADIIDWFEGKYFPGTLPIRAAGGAPDRPFHALSSLLPYWTGKARAPAAAPTEPAPASSQPAAQQAPTFASSSAVPAASAPYTGGSSGPGGGAGDLVAGYGDAGSRPNSNTGGYGGPDGQRGADSFPQQRTGGEAGAGGGLGLRFAPLPASAQDASEPFGSRFAPPQPQPLQQLPLPGAFSDFGGGDFGGNGVGLGHGPAGGMGHFGGEHMGGAFGHGRPQPVESLYGHARAPEVHPYMQHLVPDGAGVHHPLGGPGVHLGGHQQGHQQHPLNLRQVRKLPHAVGSG